MQPTGCNSNTASAFACAPAAPQELVGTVRAVADSASEAGPGSIPPLDLATWTGAAPAPDEKLGKELFDRSQPYGVRRPQQPSFPPFPTTTIGSFPQTPAIRKARLQFKKGSLRWVEDARVCVMVVVGGVGGKFALA
jgi:hypothetical protein